MIVDVSAYCSDHTKIPTKSNIGYNSGNTRFVLGILNLYLNLQTILPQHAYYCISTCWYAGDAVVSDVELFQSSS